MKGTRKKIDMSKKKEKNNGGMLDAGKKEGRRSVSQGGERLRKRGKAVEICEEKRGDTSLTKKTQSQCLKSNGGGG